MEFLTIGKDSDIEKIRIVKIWTEKIQIEKIRKKIGKEQKSFTREPGKASITTKVQWKAPGLEVPGASSILAYLADALKYG